MVRPAARTNCRMGGDRRRKGGASQALRRIARRYYRQCRCVRRGKPRRQGTKALAFNGARQRNGESAGRQGSVGRRPGRGRGYRRLASRSRRHWQYRAPKRGASAVGRLRKRNRCAGRRQPVGPRSIWLEKYCAFAMTRAPNPRCLDRSSAMRSRSKCFPAIRRCAGPSPSKSGPQRPPCGLRRSNRTVAGSWRYSQGKDRTSELAHQFVGQFLGKPAVTAGQDQLDLEWHSQAACPA